MKAIIDQCDIRPIYEGSVPAVLRTADGRSINTRVEFWRNPADDSAEPFVPVYVNERGRIETPRIERVIIHNPQADHSYPDWGGLGDKELFESAHDTAAPVYFLGGALLVAAVLLWKITEFLGRR